MRDRLVFPLDVPTLDEAHRWIGLLREEVGVFKVGLELFTAAGPDAVRAVRDAGAPCFLDLKLHDIPETMARAVESAARLGASYLTIHASAGPRALARAEQAARGTPVRLLAVTILTSLDAADLTAIGVEAAPDDAALRLARVALDAGIDGLVCSALECGRLRAASKEALLVVPGVRPRGADPGDQRRVATPASAIALGADLIVVGRPIRDAADPVEAARDIAREI